MPTVWLHSVQQCYSTCAFLADVGQVVVAGHVVPLAILMGDGHHTVLTACKEVIWLALPPVLIHLHISKQQNSAAFAFIRQCCQTRLESINYNLLLSFLDEILVFSVYLLSGICVITQELLHK